MTSESPILSAEIEAYVTRPPPRSEMWSVLAFWPKGGWWALKGEKGSSDAAIRSPLIARKCAEGLVETGWIHVCLIRIPGNEEITAPKEGEQ